MICDFIYGAFWNQGSSLTIRRIKMIINSNLYAGTGSAERQDKARRMCCPRRKAFDRHNFSKQSDNFLNTISIVTQNFRTYYNPISSSLTI